MVWNSRHLEETNNTYWTHMRFAGIEAFDALFIGVIMVIHSIVPWLLSRGHFQRYIKRASARLKADQDRMLKDDWDIIDEL